MTEPPPAVGRGSDMSAGPEILRLRNAAISRSGCFAWNRGNDDPLFFTPCFDKLPFYPKSFLPLVRQRRVIPPGTQTAYSKGYISSLVGHSVVKVHGLDRRQSAQTRRGRYACAAWRLVEMCLNLRRIWGWPGWTTPAGPNKIAYSQSATTSIKQAGVTQFRESFSTSSQIRCALVVKSKAMACSPLFFSMIFTP